MNKIFTIDSVSVVNITAGTKNSMILSTADGKTKLTLNEKNEGWEYYEYDDKRRETYYEGFIWYKEELVRNITRTFWITDTRYLMKMYDENDKIISWCYVTEKEEIVKVIGQEKIVFRKKGK